MSKHIIKRFQRCGVHHEELNESATMFAMTAFWSNVLDTQNYGYNTFINELKKMGEYMTKTKNK